MPSIEATTWRDWYSSWDVRVMVTVGKRVERVEGIGFRDYLPARPTTASRRLPRRTGR